MIQNAFQIEEQDNVATALTSITPGLVMILGAASVRELAAAEAIPEGHKIALQDITVGEPILKYGVVIGQATRPVAKGCWVHLHVMKSLYDERSGHLDVKTGAPQDIRYE